MWDSERSTYARSLLSGSSEGWSAREIIGHPLSVVAVRGLVDATFCSRLEADVRTNLAAPSSLRALPSKEGPAGIRSRPR
jgi:hypothetical protein